MSCLHGILCIDTLVLHCGAASVAINALLLVKIVELYVTVSVTAEMFYVA